jgi:hypothetical protein
MIESIKENDMNTNICKTIVSSQYFKYYRSEWTWIKPKSTQSFIHKLGQLPSFYNIYVAAKLSSNVTSLIPTSVYPYHDYPGGGIKVNMISINDIAVSNGSDAEVYVRVEALYVNVVTTT